MNVASLQKLMSLGLTTEQMAGVIDVLAVELAPLETMRAEVEARRSKDRLRKFRGNSVERSVEIPSQSPTPPRDIYNTLSQGNNLPPTPKHSRLHGTNPRALGRNPRAVEPEPDGFDAFWTAYPKRDDNGDRKGALKAFGPAVQRAGGAELVIRAAGRYADHCRDKGKIGTEFVKQARSWLNGDLWSEWLPQEPARPAVARIAVREGTPAWDAWKATGRRFNAMDLKDEHGHVIGRGWYFESEFPQQEQAA